MSTYIRQPGSLSGIDIGEFFGKEHKNNSGDTGGGRQYLKGRTQSDGTGFFNRIAVNSAADGRKCDGGKILLGRKGQAVTVAGGKEPGILRVSGINRTNGMDHIPGRQPITPRDPGLSGWASSKGATFGEEFGTCGSMNGPINASSPQKAGVRRIHDGVHGKARDVSYLDFDSIQ